MKTILVLILVTLPWQGIEGYSEAKSGVQAQPTAWPNPATNYHWWRDVCPLGYKEHNT